jgi:hypothetical protein
MVIIYEANAFLFAVTSAISDRNGMIDTAAGKEDSV